MSRPLFDEWREKTTQPGLTGSGADTLSHNHSESAVLGDHQPEFMSHPGDSEVLEAPRQKKNYNFARRNALKTEDLHCLAHLLKSGARKLRRRASPSQVQTLYRVQRPNSNVQQDKNLTKPIFRAQLCSKQFRNFSLIANLAHSMSNYYLIRD